MARDERGGLGDGPQLQWAREEQVPDGTARRRPAEAGLEALQALVRERLLRKLGGRGLQELQHQEVYQSRDWSTGSKTSF